MTLLGVRVLMIAIGCALGGVSRFFIGYFVQQQWSSDFPYGTLMVNLLGSFLIGVIFAILTRQGIERPILNGLLITGFLGGFTTFSSFSLEAVTLMQSDRWIQSVVYVLLSCVGCFSLSIIGVKIVQTFLSRS